MGEMGCADDLMASIERLEGVCNTLIPTGVAQSAVPAVRCLNVYLERLGALQMESTSLQKRINNAFESGHFVTVQPSVLAAVAYRAERERQGILPAWPTALADLTGWKGDDTSHSAFDTAMVMMRAFDGDGV